MQSGQNIPESLKKKYNSIEGDSLYIANKLVQLLNEFYAEGFLTASIDSVHFSADTVLAKIYRGKKYYSGEIVYMGQDGQVKEILEINNKKNKTGKFNLPEIFSIRKEIISYYENSGYPFASLYFNPVRFNDSFIHLHLKINPNDYYFIDSIIVKGDAKISRNYLYHYLRLNPGDPFNQHKINQVSKQIDDLNFLSEIKPAEVEFSENDVDLYLYLEKQKANMFNGIIGFLPENETTGKMLITGELNLNLVNSFGQGEDIFLRWERLESSTQKLNIDVGYPFIFKTNLGVDGNFELYKKDSSYLSLNAGAGLKLAIDYKKFIRGYYRHKSSSRIGNIIDSDVNFADIKSNVFGVSFYLNQLDYKYNPQKGIELNIFGGAGFKNVTESKTFLDSLNLNPDTRTTEIDAGLDFKFYFPIYKQFIFHFSNKTRYLDQFTDKDAVFFENELYRFGGANTLRGFDENAFHASVYSLQNIELRYLFERHSAFYVFWNGAYYYKNVTQQVTEDFPWGFGIGADFETTAGIFTLSYALGKQFDNPFEIRSAKIHFGYVSRF
ncbi:MAG: POTRA domain-containing protein [Bacteroidales bacterium]